MSYKVNDEAPRFQKAWKKYTKTRQSEKTKPGDLLKAIVTALAADPRNGDKPFEMHPVNKYRAQNLWSLTTYSRHGERLFYVINEKTKTVDLIMPAVHDDYDRIFESEEGDA